MPAEIVLLLAAERSGTHLLRSMLSTSRSIASPGEICNAASEEIRTAPASFLRYRETAYIANPEYFYPTGANQTRLLNDYFALVRSRFSGKAIVILDVKYAHIHNFNAFWWDMISRPFLLDYAQQNRMKIIHLVREKPYQTAISNMYAQHTGVWRATNASAVKTVKMTVDRRVVDERARRLVRVINLFRQWLSGCESIQIAYEALASDAEGTIARLTDFLSPPMPMSPTPGFVKTTPPYAEVIDNLTEIEDLIDMDIDNMVHA